MTSTLGFARSHSRPRVSDDSPYSESQFKTMKYHRTFPERFGSIEDGRAYFGPFMTWYDDDKREVRALLDKRHRTSMNFKSKQYEPWSREV